MYDFKSNLIIGFHGCDADTAKCLVNNPDKIIKSSNPYDWLGHGMYFWENNEDRAREWAREKQAKKGRRVLEAAVVGAVIQLGYCCDLTDTRYLETLRFTYYRMKRQFEKEGRILPVNKDVSTDRVKNKLLRALDCRVIEYMHGEYEERYKKNIALKGFSNTNLFDSARGVFIEGDRIYEGAEIFEKTHIQICVRNPNCIKGFFLPRKRTIFLPE